MPRKAAAELAVVPLVPGQGRPEPPPDLDPLEQGVWRDIVAALPGHWIDPAGQVVLRRLVAQAAVAERQEARLRQLRARMIGRKPPSSRSPMVLWPKLLPSFSLSCGRRRARGWHRARLGNGSIRLPSLGPGRSRPHAQAQAKTTE